MSNPLPGVTVAEPTTRPEVPAGPTSRLRFWLGADAVVTTANGLAYLAAAPALVPLLGWTTSGLRAAGLFLVAFGLVVTFAARRPQPHLVTVVITVNAAWVLVSVVAAAGWVDLSPAGRLWAVAQAVVVGVFAVAQLISSGRRR